MTATTAFTGNNPVADAAGRAHQMVDSVAEKAAPAVQTAAIKAHETIDKAASAGTSAADWAKANGTQIAEKSSALAEVCSGYVQARPFVTVAGALAIGYLVGRVMR